MKARDHWRLAVVLHHAVLQDRDGVFTKETWYDFLLKSVRPHFSSVSILAPVHNPFNGHHAHLTHRIDPDMFDLVPLQTDVGAPSHIVAKLAATARLLWRFWVEVGRHDALLILLPTWRGLAAAFLARLRRKPYIAYLGGDYIAITRLVGPRATLFRFLERRALSEAVFVLCAGRRMANAVRKINPATQETVPVMLLKHGHLFRRPDVCQGVRLRCLYVGNLGGLKRVEDVIRCVRLLRDRTRLDVTLTVVGPGDTTRLKRLAHELEIAEICEFPGYVPNGPELFAHYRKADIFLLASASEGFPRVLYEAMAHGVPIVATEVGSIPDVVEHERAGLLVPVGRPDLMADACARILAEAGLRRFIIDEGYRRVEKILASNPREQVSDLVSKYLHRGRKRLAVVTNLPAAYRLSLFKELSTRSSMHLRVFFTAPPSEATERAVFREPLEGFECEWAAGPGGLPLRLLYRLHRFRPTTIIVGGAGIAAWIALLYACTRQIRICLWWGGTVHSERRVGSWMTRVRSALFRRVDAFLAYGEESREYLLSLGMPSVRVYVIGNVTTDVDQFQERIRSYLPEREAHRNALGLEGLVFVAAGALSPGKNYLPLIAAIRHLRETGEHVSLLLIGKGDQQRAISAEVRGLAGFVHIHEVEWREMPRFLSLGDVFVHPSQTDRWPQVVNEAMAASLPVVVTRRCGLSDFVREGVEGFVVEGYDTPSLQRSLEACVRYGAELRAMGGRALGRVRQYGPSRVASQIEALVCGSQRQGKAKGPTFLADSGLGASTLNEAPVKGIVAIGDCHNVVAGEGGAPGVGTVGLPLGRSSDHPRERMG